MGAWQRHIYNPAQARLVMNEALNTVYQGLRGGPAVLTLTRPTRSLDQNRLMWPLLTDWSKQVTHLDGKKYSPDDWKHIITAAFEECVRFAPNLNGTGMIAFGARTSKYSKRKFSQLIEFIYAEGTERGVVWSQQSESNIAEVRG